MNTGRNMKLLFFQWHSFMNKGIERGLKELEIPYDTFFYQFNDWEKDDAFLEQFRAYLKAGAYTDVLSVNFSPLISMLCEELGIVYTAWVYDSPLHIRNLESLKNSCNRIFFFDRGQAEEHRKDGVNAMHLPLAVDTEVFRINASKREKEDYRTDISLVGNFTRQSMHILRHRYRAIQRVSGRNCKCTGQSVRRLFDTGINYR